MDKSVARRMFESLASGLRLDVFCFLVQSGDRGRVAGEIAAALGVAPTNLSFHLKAMLASGLVSVQPEGRYQRYRANVPNVLRVLAFVMENCAQAGACAAGGARSTLVRDEDGGSDRHGKRQSQRGQRRRRLRLQAGEVDEPLQQ